MALGTCGDPLGTAVSQGHALGYAMRVCPVEAWLRPQPRIDWVFPWMLHLYLFSCTCD